MEKVEGHLKTKITAGDAAVNGLLNGLVGGVAMAAVVIIFSLLGGKGFGYLGYFSAGAPVLPLVGLVMHLAVSTIYGLLYGLIRKWTRLDRLTRLPGWLAGLIYAMGLWVFAVTLLLPGAKSMILTLPWVVFFTGHFAYGLVLGLRQKP